MKIGNKQGGILENVQEQDEDDSMEDYESSDEQSCDQFEASSQSS